MKLQNLFRPILGVIFAILGYYLSTRVTIDDQGVRIGVQIVLTLVSAAAGVYLVPFIGEWLRYWSGVFAQTVAKEVISQLHLPRIPGRKSKNGKKPNGKATYQNPIVVDTSALIDGRIADVAESGFLFGTLIVPRFVLSELQHIADHPDALRRGRGRRGLEILEGLKKSKQIKLVVYEPEELKEKDIDDKLIRIAKNLKAKILTTDFNLNKVATVSGIKILNINELVTVLKTTLLPGEKIEVKVIQEGKEKSQGVGYLPDGTMIVVEDGGRFIGKSVPTTVSRVLQTAAGRMIFVQAEQAERKQGS
jgi:uncharacterized protein YacL